MIYCVFVVFLSFFLFAVHILSSMNQYFSALIVSFHKYWLNSYLYCMYCVDVTFYMLSPLYWRFFAACHWKTHQFNLFRSFFVCFSLSNRTLRLFKMHEIRLLKRVRARAQIVTKFCFSLSSRCFSLTLSVSSVYTTTNDAKWNMAFFCALFPSFHLISNRRVCNAVYIDSSYLLLIVFTALT